MSNVAVNKVTVSINVELANGEKMTHCSISVDLSGPQALVEVQQQDYPAADEFTRRWLESAIRTHQQKNDLNKLPDQPQ